MSKAPFQIAAIIICAIAIAVFTIGTFFAYHTCHGNGPPVQIIGLLVGLLAFGLLLGKVLLVPSKQSALAVGAWLVLFIAGCYAFFTHIFECMNT